MDYNQIDGPTQYGSPKELSNDNWRQAMLNKNSLNTPTPISAVLDDTATLVNQPPNVEYSPQFDYQLHEDYSRLDANEYSYYNPIDRTFAKRKFNTSYGSNQSSLNRTPVKHVAKRGRLDRTWNPGRTPNDSDDDFQDELDSTDPLEDLKDPLKDTMISETALVQCPYCSRTFDNQREKFTHIIKVHGDGLADALGTMMPKVCTNCSDKNESVAFCDQCLDNPFLCNPCVLAHRRVSFTKDHGIIFSSQSAVINQRDKNEENPFVIFEKILDSVYPERSGLSEPPNDPKEFIPMRCSSNFKSTSEIEEELKLIRLQSLTLASCLKKASGSEASGDGFQNSSSVSSKSSSDSSTTEKTLTGEIIADNLLSLFNVESVDVKAKIAVVIEMLVRMNAIDPSLFCDKRSMKGFRSLLSIRDTKFLYKALTSLNHLVMAVGKKGVFFGLVKIRTDLSELLEMIQQPSTELDDAKTSIFNPAMVKDLALSILKTLDSLIS